MTCSISLTASYDLSAVGGRENRHLYWLRRPETIDENGDGWEEEIIGPITERHVINLFRRKHRDGYTGGSLYRLDGSEEWHELRSFGHREWADPDLLEKMRAAGIKSVEWLTGHHDDECDACKALEGKIFPINEPPPIPPIECRCESCLCILVVSRTAR